MLDEIRDIYRGVGCQQFVNGLYQTIGENKHH